MLNFFKKDLVQDNRQLILEGHLTKVCRRSTGPRRVLLFNDILVYGKLLSKNTLTKQVILPLENMMVVPLPDERGFFIFLSFFIKQTLF